MECYFLEPLWKLGNGTGNAQNSRFRLNFTLLENSELNFSKSSIFASKFAHFELNKRCSCPADDSPDDMIMGSCMAQYDISMVHLNNFHQAKWEEYRYVHPGIAGPISLPRN